uniref:Uncharacterized protein n=1 Tax=Arundo donax TaxID=35708 RepID=A0A0A9APN9_ARUDO
MNGTILCTLRSLKSMRMKAEWLSTAPLNTSRAVVQF